MEQGNAPIGQDLLEAHECSLAKAEEHCHFKSHAKNAVETYLASMFVELKERGFLLSIVKIQDEQDN